MLQKFFLMKGSLIAPVSHWFSKPRSFWWKGSDKRGESDKAKEGKLLDSLMRALLPVWESLVMLGPDQGERVKGREGGRGGERGRWDKRGTQENWQGCRRRHRKCQPPPLFFFSRSGTGMMDRRFLRDTREEDGDGWGNIHHMSFSGNVVDCKSFENADPTFSQMLVLFCLLTHLVFSHHVKRLNRHLLTKQRPL